jgi:hypothetical protein
MWVFYSQKIQGGEKMKTILLFSMCLIFIATSANVNAETKASLGKGNIAVKFDYIVFTDSQLDSEDDGIYIGLEGYGRIMPNFYLGGEVGQAINVAVSGEDISFFPIELNVKYAFETVRNLVLDFGAGGSYSYAEIQHQTPFGDTQDDWLFGAQFFTDLTYKIRWFTMGINAKYQITEQFKDESLDLNNFRLGIQFGAAF